MIPTCKQVSVMLSQEQDRKLSLLERLRLKLHLAICNRCRQIGEHIVFLRRAIRAYRDHE